jgi:hypothetical protein
MVPQLYVFPIAMAAQTPTQRKAIDALTSSVAVGDRVYRHFERHELGVHDKEQWIHGKVTASKSTFGRGQKKNATWWTITFDAPAKRPLMCKVDEVVTMKLAAENYRNKNTALLDHVGKQLVVQWTEEDSDLSFNEWSSDLRIGVVTQFVAHTHEFMLRFKCGYEKLIPDDELVLLYDASESLKQNKKVKVQKQVRKAEEEWADKGAAPAEIDLAAQLLLVEEQKHADDSTANKQNKFNVDSDGNSSDSDEDVKVVEHTPNTARRILWQRGHGSLLPSTVRGIIAEATVRTMAEARVPLQQLGFAIIEDITEVYAPKNRCTKEQRDFIHKCKYA